MSLSGIKFQENHFQNLLSMCQWAQKSSPAELPSSYSHLSEWYVNPRYYLTPRGVLVSYVALACMGLTPIQEEEYRRKILTIAQFRKREGKWNEVYLLAEKTKLSPGSVLMWFGDNGKSPRELYSLKRELHAFYRSLRIKDLQKEQEKIRIRRPQRKRGYDDKGTLPSLDSKARRLANEGSWEEPQKPFTIKDLGKSWLPDDYGEKGPSRVGMLGQTQSFGQKRNRGAQLYRKYFYQRGGI